MSSFQPQFLLTFLISHANIDRKNPSLFCSSSNPRYGVRSPQSVVAASPVCGTCGSALLPAAAAGSRAEISLFSRLGKSSRRTRQHDSCIDTVAQHLEDDPRHQIWPLRVEALPPAHPGPLSLKEGPPSCHVKLAPQKHATTGACTGQLGKKEDCREHRAGGHTAESTAERAAV